MLVMRDHNSLLSVLCQDAVYKLGEGLLALEAAD